MISSLFKKNVMVTGGLGFIGSNLAIRCVEEGANVTVFDNLASGSGGNIFNVNQVKNDLEIVNGDVTDYELLCKKILKQEVLFNCAASTSHHLSLREPWLDMDVNSRGVINILESICEVNKDLRLIHIGTTTQLGELQYRPADESHPEFPLDIYSANKMVSEKYVIIYARTHGIDATVIRLPNVYGPRAAIHSPEFTFNNYFIGLALRKRPITVYRPGTQLRNVLYVDDVVDALLATVGVEESFGETFFSVGERHHSVGEIAQLTAEIFETEVEYIDWPKDKLQLEVGDAVISNKKFRNRCNWIQKTALEVGLEKTRKYYHDNLKEYISIPES